MNNSFSDAVKSALNKKQQTLKPQVKNKNVKCKNRYGPPMITASPVRKASGRGA